MLSFDTASKSKEPYHTFGDIKRFIFFTNVKLERDPVILVGVKWALYNVTSLVDKGQLEGTFLFVLFARRLCRCLGEWLGRCLTCDGLNSWNGRSGWICAGSTRGIWEGWKGKLHSKINRKPNTICLVFFCFWKSNSKGKITASLPKKPEIPEIHHKQMKSNGTIHTIA